MAPPAKLPPRPVLWLVFAAIAVLAFANIGSRDLLHPDEGRYAEIAREMAATGDFVTPRLNGLKYFEKPPLQYWITAFAYRAFGVHEWTARLWPAVAGLVAVAAVGVAGAMLGGCALGAFAAVALAGTLWHAGMAQILSLDAGLACFLALAFGALAVAQQPERTAGSRRPWMWLAWAALAGATLSKGPIGIVLPAGAVVIYSALCRDYAIWRRLHLASGLALYLVLTAPWFIAVARVNDEFLSFFFVHEHLARFLTDEHRRTGAWWYFVPLALAGSLPWLASLAYGAPRAWRDRGTRPGAFSWRRLALVWAAFVFLFFSASGSKLPSYILPMFAPLALVAADLLLTLPTTTLVRLSLPGAILAFLAAVAVFAGYDRVVDHLSGGPQPVEILAAYGPWLKGAVAVAAGGAMAAAVAFALADSSPRARFTGTALLSLSTLAAVVIAIAGFDVFSATRSTSAILRAAQADAPFARGAPVYQIAMYDQTVPFYLDRTTTVVAFRDELALGIDAEPERQIPTVA
ncbi:MAG TPA: phospholipid carrier-dependent glycosyltransferase, partial [Casimicrobiaceae bacterium]|nr:phospholipid carrier-dependent glycosyltransferase [Casimicrobiaceae bacterium]